MHRAIRFTDPITSSEFASTLSKRIDDYFESRKISKHANASMVFKTILGFASLIAVYVAIMMDRSSGLGFIGMYVILGFAQLYVAFNVAHDANHGAYSQNDRINKVLSWSFDICGVSSYMWRLMHNDSHHALVNIHGPDTNITSPPALLRFSPYDKRTAIHRYQHIYASLLYCLATLDWVTMKDFYWFFTVRQYGNRKINSHPRVEFVFMVVTKAFYYMYMLVLPIMFLSVPWYLVMVAFFIQHCFTGFTIALIFQPTHITEHTVFGFPDDEGQIDNNFLLHIFDCTTDYAWQNPIANWLLGCLNVHVIHHMFPKICHVHYPALTQIIRSTAEEFGAQHQEKKTITGAYLAHLRALKALGRIDNPFVLEEGMAKPLSC